MSEEKRTPWFNRSAFALAGELRVKDPRVAALTGPRWTVFIAAASFVGLGQECREDPKLFASAATVAERAGVSVRTAESVLPYLCKEGLLEHTGKRVTGADGRAGPVIYRLLALRDAYMEADARSAGDADQKDARSAGRADQDQARSAGDAEEGTARGADDSCNPWDSKTKTKEPPHSVGPPTPGRGDDDALDLAVSIGVEVEHRLDCGPLDDFTADLIARMAIEGVVPRMKIVALAMVCQEQQAWNWEPGTYCAETGLVCAGPYEADVADEMDEMAAWSA